jgi:hypothetical protein
MFRYQAFIPGFSFVLQLAQTLTPLSFLLSHHSFFLDDFLIILVLVVMKFVFPSSEFGRLPVGIHHLEDIITLRTVGLEFWFAGQYGYTGP